MNTVDPGQMAFDIGDIRPKGNDVAVLDNLALLEGGSFGNRGCRADGEERRRGDSELLEVEHLSSRGLVVVKKNVLSI